MFLHSNDELMAVRLMEDSISSIYFRLNALKALKVINLCRLKKKNLINEKAFEILT